MPRFASVGNLPVRNFRDGTFPNVDKISANDDKRNDPDRHGGLFCLSGSMQENCGVS